MISSKIIIVTTIGRWRLGIIFLKSKPILSALNYYKGFTYIEVGDGDELWENRSFSAIVETYRDIFLLLAKYYKEKVYLSMVS